MVRSKLSRFTTEDPPLYPSNWVLTFSDLLTLLLTFFVLRVAAYPFQRSPQVQTNQPHSITLNRSQELPRATAESGMATESGTATELATIPGSRLFSVTKHSTETTLVFSGPAFLAGSDELSLGAVDVFRSAGRSFSKVSSGNNPSSTSVSVTATSSSYNATPHFRIDSYVGSQTDIGRFTTPWELAQARSIAAVRQLIDTGVDPQAISAAAYVVSQEEKELPRRLNRLTADQLVVSVSWDGLAPISH